MMIEILSIGSGMALQDAGRLGWRRYGVPSGGAMDLNSMHVANHLLGNPLNSTVLEISLQGTRLRVMKDTWLAIAGADHCSQLTAGSAQVFQKGDVLEFDQRSEQMYSYIAAPGGFVSTQWLGSTSTDLRNGMGVPIRRGMKLDSLDTTPSASVEGVARKFSRELSNWSTQFELYPGPQFDAFDEESRDSFISSAWTVSTVSDRTGFRLEGSALNVPAMIPSEPVLPGSFQVPGDGQPIVTMNDGPTVGGYAKLAVLKSEDLGRFAQCSPGTKLSFTWIR